MASIISLLSEEQFQCSICLNVFTDPVTTPCGHNFCNICITHHWDTNNVCQCPLCKETFDERPRVSINKTLSEMAHQSWRSKHNPSAIQEAEDVFCHFCTETKVKAERSCWTCRRSYCEDHLLRHDFMTEFLPHRLLIAGKNLKDYVCEKHDKHLVMFCKTDHICVCESCGKSSHRSHEVVSVKDEYDEMKAELDKTEAKVKQMIQERQEKIQEVKNSVELSKKAADREIADSEQVFAAMISCIERSQAELIDVIEKEQKTTETQAEDLIKELQQELTELKKRSSELKQLSHTEDHLHLFEKFRHINTPPPTKDWTKVNVHQPSYWGAVKTAAAQLEKTLSQELKKLCDELRSIQQYVVDVTLDPDTAHRRLGLTQDGKEVHNDNMKRNLPGNAVRFTTCFSVLGKEGFSSGRFYCEVQVKDKTEWYLGVVRGSVDRKREITPRDYWTLRLRNGNECHAIAYPNVSVPVREKLQTVGVFVDYEEGLVSFYDVEARVHLYSFTGCTFTDKLYPVFNPGPYYAGQNAAPLIISPVG